MTVAPVDSKTDTIVIRDIRIEAAIVLSFRKVAVAGSNEICDVRHTIQPIAHAGSGGADPAKVLRTQA